MNTFFNLVVGGGHAFPCISNGLIPWSLDCKKDEKLLPPRKRHALEKKVHEVADKLGVKKGIEIIEVDCAHSLANARGNTLFPGKAGIVIDAQAFEDLSREAQEFFVAHEISHIKHNDPLTMHILPGLSGAASTLAMMELFPSTALFSAVWCSPASLIGFAVGSATFIFFSRWREECADRTAFSVCSAEAKTAAIAFFEKMQVTNRQDRDDPNISFASSLWRKFLINGEGEARWDVLHPPLKARIDYLKASISQDG